VLLSTEKPRCQLVSMVDLDGANPLDYQVSAVPQLAPLLQAHSCQLYSSGCAL
jgi:hypothetical protein